MRPELGTCGRSSWPQLSCGSWTPSATSRRGSLPQLWCLAGCAVIGLWPEEEHWASTTKAPNQFARPPLSSASLEAQGLQSVGH
eukprot:s99_g16.t1